MPSTKRTKLMKKVEQEQGENLETLLPRMINEKGLSATSETLGVSNASLGYWLLKLGLESRRVILRQGEIVIIMKADGTIR